MCTVHLRLAGCAGLFPMATTLQLADGRGNSGAYPPVLSNSRNSKPGDRPTRRATLFGSILGYRSAIQVCSFYPFIFLNYFAGMCIKKITIL